MRLKPSPATQRGLAAGTRKPGQWADIAVPKADCAMQSPPACKDSTVPAFFSAAQVCGIGSAGSSNIRRNPFRVCGESLDMTPHFSFLFPKSSMTSPDLGSQVHSADPLGQNTIETSLHTLCSAYSPQEE